MNIVCDNRGKGIQLNLIHLVALRLQFHHLDFYDSLCMYTFNIILAPMEVYSDCLYRLYPTYTALLLPAELVHGCGW